MPSGVGSPDATPRVNGLAPKLARRTGRARQQRERQAGANAAPGVAEESGGVIDEGCVLEWLMLFTSERLREDVHDGCNAHFRAGARAMYRRS